MLVCRKEYMTSELNVRFLTGVQRVVRPIWDIVKPGSQLKPVPAIGVAGWPVGAATPSRGVPSGLVPAYDAHHKALAVPLYPAPAIAPNRLEDHSGLQLW